MNTDEYRAQRREQPEPEEGTRPVPRFVLVIVLSLIIWGVAYIAMHSGAPLRGGDMRTAIASNPSKQISGEVVYNGNCAACHQGTGQGLGNSFPPLAESEWVTESASTPIAVVNHGLQGKITVRGKTYQGVMPAFGSQLSAEEIAAVLSYIRSEWGNEAGPISADKVEAYRTSEGDRGPWTADELRKRFGN